MNAWQQMQVVWSIDKWSTRRAVSREVLNIESLRVINIKGYHEKWLIDETFSRECGQYKIEWSSEE